MRALYCLLALILLAACTGREGVETRPEDFQVQYKWMEGSLPPPYYYDYTVSIDPQGQGEVSMNPDYPGPDVPVWTETFSLTSEELDQLFAEMLSQGLLRIRWTQEDVLPVGGSSEWMLVTAHGEEIRIPAFVPPRQQERAQALFRAVRSTVPDEIWYSLYNRREAYVQEHPNR